jgi:hypothetical protein
MHRCRIAQLEQRAVVRGLAAGVRTPRRAVVCVTAFEVGIESLL